MPILDQGPILRINLKSSKVQNDSRIDDWVTEAEDWLRIGGESERTDAAANKYFGVDLHILYIS